MGNTLSITYSGRRTPYGNSIGDEEEKARRLEILNKIQN